MMFVNTLVMLACLCLSTVTPVLSASFVLFNMTGPGVQPASVAGSCRVDRSRMSYDYEIYLNTPVTIHFESLDFVGSDFDYLYVFNGEFSPRFTYNISSNSPTSFTFVITSGIVTPGAYLFVGATNSRNQQYREMVAESPLCMERVSFLPPPSSSSSSTGMPSPTPSFVLLNITGTFPQGYPQACPNNPLITSYTHRIYLNTLVTVHFESSHFIGSDFYTLIGDPLSGNRPAALSFLLSSNSPKSFSFVVNSAPVGAEIKLSVIARNSLNQSYEVKFTMPSLCIPTVIFDPNVPPVALSSTGSNGMSSSRPTDPSSSAGLSGVNEATDPSSSAGLSEVNEAYVTTNCLLVGVLSLALTGVMMSL